MPRFAFILTLILAAVAASAAQARLFWQTYGATVAAPDGCGCVWNQNQDYFVPRHCDSGRYDLYSPCKESHYRSPACARIHPVHDGYCSPYAGWHYTRRDHVYAKHCGCTPLADYCGPWKLERCKKHCFALKDCGCCTAPTGGYGGAWGGQCSTGCEITAQTYAAGCEPRGVDSCYGWLPNVELLGGESIGGIPAMAMGSGSAGGAGAMGAIPGGMSPGMNLPAPMSSVPGVPSKPFGF
jgi:hypothetical protein